MADSNVPDTPAPTKGEEGTKKPIGLNRRNTELIASELKGQRTMSKYIQKLREVHREYAPADLEEVTRAIVQTLAAHSDVLWERLPDFVEAKKKYSLMTYPDYCLPRLDLLYILGRKILKNEWDINNPADDLHLDALLQCILVDTEEEGCGCLYCCDKA